MTISWVRRYPVGAEIAPGGVAFRVWAPDHEEIVLVGPEGPRQPLEPEGNGYFSGLVEGMGAGDRYRFALPGDEQLLPDPASRFQPDGVAGPSMVIDPRSYEWSDAGWQGPDASPVYYELHVGTFTRQGTFAASTEKLEWLKELGVTVIELMPLNTWIGTFGWGYDGVLLFAPTANYGKPDDVRQFVDRAHLLGIGVILDVVYNHFGPGEICPRYANAYYSQRPANEWGKSLNFDGPDSGPVRDFVCANAAYWIDEFHLDGLRIDATQALIDESDEHIVGCLGRDARAAARGRRILLVSENEPQQIRQVRPPQAGGFGLDALWNDDFHHSARVALTGRAEAYFHDHRGRPQEFVSAAKYGYLFQGQRYDWQNAARGSAGLDARPFNFVHFLQNHDQIANTPGSRRIGHLASPAKLRALTALLLLGPQAPMLFQGQEFDATTPFHYFLDQHGEVAKAVMEGRAEFLSQFPSLDRPEMRRTMAPPHDRATFEASRLDWTDAERNAATVALHRDLLQLRRETAALRHAQRERALDGAVVGQDAFLLRFFGPSSAADRLLIVNLGSDLALRSVPDPLYAPPDGHVWTLCWSSEDVCYGGIGQRQIDTREPWLLTAVTALLFSPEPAEPRAPAGKSEMDDWQRSLRSA